MKLRPGMTANITITVDQRVNAMKVPNAALRYAPPGVDREALTAKVRPDAVDEDSAESPTPSPPQVKEMPSPLAPGQKWNPAEKIRFVAQKRGAKRAGVVFVLNSQGTPDSRQLVLGITDGSSTEVLSGDLKAGDRVITADATTAGSAPPAAPQGGPGFLGGRGGGGRGP
jgi:HlyD family secretion protein